MAAINFGYTISKPRAIDIDRNNLRKSDEILHEMPIPRDQRFGVDYARALPYLLEKL